MLDFLALAIKNQGDKPLNIYYNGKLVTTPPLVLASKIGAADTVAAIAKPENINSSDPSEGWTALHWAASTGRLDIVKILLTHGPNLERPDIIGNTPLLVAILSGHAEVAGALLEAGAKVDVRSKQNVTPVKAAAHIENLLTIEYLLARPATIEILKIDLLEYLCLFNGVKHILIDSRKQEGKEETVARAQIIINELYKIRTETTLELFLSESGQLSQRVTEEPAHTIQPGSSSSSSQSDFEIPPVFTPSRTPTISSSPDISALSTTFQELDLTDGVPKVAPRPYSC